MTQCLLNSATRTRIRLVIVLAGLLMIMGNCPADGLCQQSSVSESAWINKSVVLILRDGRKPRGILSPKTNATHIVLRLDRLDVAIEGRFPRLKVVSIQPGLDEENFSSIPSPPSPDPEMQGNVSRKSPTNEELPRVPLPPALPDDHDESGQADSIRHERSSKGDKSAVVGSHRNEKGINSEAALPRNTTEIGGRSSPNPVPRSWINYSRSIGANGATVFDPSAVSEQTYEKPIAILGDTTLHVQPQVVVDPAHIQSVVIEATLGNWDRDAEIDGILVRVQPVGYWGEVIPAAGSLEIELVVERRLFGGAEFGRESFAFQRLETWTSNLGLDDFDTNGATIRLPFNQFQPERDLDIAPEGLALATVRIPGVGTFDAADANVVLRPASRFRDELQLRTNRRRYSAEQPLSR